MENNTSNEDRYAYIAPCFYCGKPVIGYAKLAYALKHDAPVASLCIQCSDKLQTDINNQE